MKKSKARVKFMRLAVRFVLIYGLVTGGGGMMLGQQRQEVESVVKRQLELYPQSRLIDLYKNFFQDKFGPGHMVADTASAGAYIRRELALMRSESGGKVVGLTQSEVAEVIGWEGRFVRVDLAVIEMGIVSYKRFSEAFFESSSSHILPDIEKWKRRICCSPQQRVDCCIQAALQINTKRYLGEAYFRTIRALAQHSIPSSLPTNPSFSVVVAFIETAVMSHSRISAIIWRIRGMNGPILGR